MVKPLDIIIKSRKAMEILEFLLNNEGERNQANLIKSIKISKTTAIKWLGILDRKGFMISEVKGKSKFFILDYNNPVIKQLKILLTVMRLYGVFSEFKNEGMEVYLYGSAARGEDTKNSDIDILILGKIENKKLVKLAEIASDNLKKEVKPLVLNPIEYSNLIRKDRIFYENIEKNKIKIL